jgi:Zn finger protein HypA/HybF involved in hydrogenase expression
MHELSLVEDVVEAAGRRLQELPAERVVAVRLSCGPGFDPAIVRNAFVLLSAGTRLESASVEIDVLPVSVTCCGVSQAVTSERLCGHQVLCQVCGTSRAVPEAERLELVGLTTAGGP